MPAAEQLCLDNSTTPASEPATPDARSSAATAPTVEHGGQSSASSVGQPEPAESTTDARPADPNIAVLDGWELDASNVCGHKLHRTVRMLTGDPVISLTAGDLDDEEAPTVCVPERVLAWLLTGEAPS